MKDCSVKPQVTCIRDEGSFFPSYSRLQSSFDISFEMATFSTSGVVRIGKTCEKPAFLVLGLISGGKDCSSIHVQMRSNLLVQFRFRTDH